MDAKFAFLDAKYRVFERKNLCPRNLRPRVWTRNAKFFHKNAKTCVRVRAFAFFASAAFFQCMSLVIVKCGCASRDPQKRKNARFAFFASRARFRVQFASRVRAFSHPYCVPASMLKLCILCRQY